MIKVTIKASSGSSNRNRHQKGSRRKSHIQSKLEWNGRDQYGGVVFETD